MSINMTSHSANTIIFIKHKHISAALVFLQFNYKHVARKRFYRHLLLCFPHIWLFIKQKINAITHTTQKKKNPPCLYLIYLFKHSPVEESTNHSIHTRPAPPPQPNCAEHIRQRAIGQRVSPPSPSANQTRRSLFSPAHSIFFRIRMCVVWNTCAGYQRKQNKYYKLHKTI